MLQFKKITLTQFKNYALNSFVFNEKIIGICGLNGMGKTNLLDAIYYCCFTKSYFSNTDGQNIQFDSDGFRIEASFLSAEEREKHRDLSENKKHILQKANEIICVYKGVGKKEILLNGVAYTKYSEHIGKLPAVIIAPDDIELILGGSELRRRFIDSAISQMNNEYLQQLIFYNKILQQRNSTLKFFAEQGKTDWQLLEVLDQQIVQPCNYIFIKRKEFIAALIPLVQQFYNQIAGNNETINLQYESQLNTTNFAILLEQLRQKDFLLQRTNAGVHKDDISIQLNEHVFKTTASQGQRKSLLFALKLAEFELLKSNKGFAPILFLDDVFEKLDDNRMKHLLHWVCNQNTGQVFITDTHKQRLQNTFKNLQVQYQIIELYKM